MACFGMRDVEYPCVRPVQEMHALGQGWALSLEYEMVVIAHQAIAQASPAVFAARPGEQCDEKSAIVVAVEYLCTSISPGHHVVVRVGVVGS